MLSINIYDGSNESFHKIRRPYRGTVKKLLQMTSRKEECTESWAASLGKKVLKGKLYLYKDNVPQSKPFMFKV